MKTKLVLTILTGAACMAAQDRNRSVDEISLPLPIQSPRAIQPGPFEPLTPKEKLHRALKNTFGPKALGNRLIVTGIDHWRDHPYEWSGNMDGFAQRFGSRMGHTAVRQAVQTSADIALKTDPRYDRCNCTGFVPRTGHAWKRVFVMLKDDGSDTIATSRLLGAYVTPMITDQWYPDRLNTWNHKMQSGSEFLMWRGLTNMLREFWPEISRKVPLLRNRSSFTMGE